MSDDNDTVGSSYLPVTTGRMEGRRDYSASSVERALQVLRQALRDGTAPAFAEYEVVNVVQRTLTAPQQAEARFLLTQLAPRVRVDESIPILTSAEDSSPERVEEARRRVAEIEEMAAKSTSDEEWRDENERREWQQVIRLATQPLAFPKHVLRRPIPRPQARGRSARRVVRARSHGPPGRRSEDSDPEPPRACADLTPLAGHVAAELAYLLGPERATYALIRAVEGLSPRAAGERVLGFLEAWRQ